MMNTRAAVIKDAPEVAAVMRHSIEELCHEDHHGQKEILDPWLENKTPESVAEWISSPDYFCVTGLKDQDQIIGFGMLNKAGEILLLYTSPDHVGLSIGHAILTAMSFYENHGYLSSGACSPRPDCLSCQGMFKALLI